MNTGESIFTFDELFYSKTDRKGIILSGNSVFQRVSEYEWSELLRHPHNTIRHPDMPRGVFHLLWRHLLANQPIGAFVKNRSKTGLYYWVFATALPVKDGFISVRLKPGGALLEVVESEYTKLRSVEFSDKLSPEKSDEILVKRLAELGFPTYLNFMAKALIDQIENRCNHMNTSVPTEIRVMRQLHSSCADVVKKSREILQAYQKTMYIPLNLEVSSAHLGEEGQQISVVASQYQKMATEIRNEMLTFEKMANQMNDEVEMGLFYIGANQLMKDVESFLSKDAGQGQQEDTGLEDIRALSKAYMDQSIEGIKKVQQVVEQFSKTCSNLQSIGAGLELVRITGKIESAKLVQRNEVDALLSDLKEFQLTLSQGLRDISATSSAMSSQSKEIAHQLRG